MDCGALVMGALWALNIAFFAYALREVHPFMVNAIRFTIAAPIVWLLHHREFGDPVLILKRGTRVSTAKAVAYAVVLLFGYQFFYGLGLDASTASNAALILASVPLWATLAGWYFLFQPMSQGSWLGMGFGFFGLLMLTLFGGHVDFGDGTLGGNVMLLAAALVAGVGGRLARPRMRSVASPTLILVALGICVPIFWLLAIPHIATVAREGARFQVWLTIVASGISTAFMLSTLGKLRAQHVQSGHVRFIYALMPLCTMVVGSSYLHETLTPPQAMGAALLFGGAWMVQRFRDHDDSEDAPLPPLRTVRIARDGTTRTTEEAPLDRKRRIPPL